MSKQILELTRIGKDACPKLEPRILREAGGLLGEAAKKPKKDET
jgi:hypothetical protein